MTIKRVGPAIAVITGVSVTGLVILVYAKYQGDIHQVRRRISIGSQIKAKI
jgi:hypothetical protein